MKLVQHSATDAVVESKDGQLFKFNFQAPEEELCPLFSGPQWGTMIWEGSIELCKKLEQERQDLVQDCKIMELGACCALPSMLCSTMGAKLVVATDLGEYMEPLQSSIDNNQEVVNMNVLETEEFAWSKKNAVDLVEKYGEVDVVLAAECISTDCYGRESWQALIDVVDIMCKDENGTCLLVQSHRAGDGWMEFMKMIKPKFSQHTVEIGCAEPFEVEIHKFSR